MQSEISEKPFFKAQKRREINQDNFEAIENESELNWTNGATRHNEWRVTLGFVLEWNKYCITSWTLYSIGIALEHENESERERATQEEGKLLIHNIESSIVVRPASIVCCCSWNYAVKWLQMCNKVEPRLCNDWIVPRKSDFLFQTFFIKREKQSSDTQCFIWDTKHFVSTCRATREEKEFFFRCPIFALKRQSGDLWVIFRKNGLIKSK